MWRWLKTNHQALTAVGAMVVGLAALYVAWDQARVMRDQQHGAVFPALQIDGYSQNTTDQTQVGVRISNSGVGPAIIESVTLLRDGEPQQTLSPLISRMPEGYNQSWTSMRGRIMAPGAEVAPIEFSWRPERMSAEQTSEFIGEWFRWDVEICYCSVFDRCWQTSTDRDERPRPAPRCQRDDEDIFQVLANTPQLQDDAQ